MVEAVWEKKVVSAKEESKLLLQHKWKAAKCKGNLSPQPTEVHSSEMNSPRNTFWLVLQNL